MATLDAVARNVNAGTDYNPPTSNGQNAYDLQRQQIAAKNEAARKQQQDALKRRMAAQGIQDSGIEEKGVRNTDVAAEQANASEQGQVDVSQLQSVEAAEQAELQREEQEKLQAESIGAQEQMQGTQIASTEKLAGKQIASTETMQEKQLAQSASQFATQQDFNKWAAQQGFNEQDATRAWQSAENTKAQQAGLTQATTITGMNIASQEKMAADSNAIAEQGLTLQQAAQQGYTGADGKHVMGSLELQAQGLTLEQAQTEGYTDPITKQHVPGTNELTAMGQTNQFNIAQLDVDSSKTLEGMREAWQTGQTTLEYTLQQQNNLITATAKSYYDMGMAKQVLDPTTLANLQKTDPISYQSYLDGQAGRSLTEWQKNVTDQTSYRDALLLDASKILGTPGGAAAINKIFSETTGTGFTPATASSATSPQTEAYFDPTTGKIVQIATTAPASNTTTGTFNAADLSKYDLSKGQVYTDTVDFDNPAYTDGDNMVFTKDTASNMTNKLTGTNFNTTVPAGVYTVTKVDATEDRKNTSDTMGTQKVSQPVKITRLVNKDDPSKTYDVYSEDVGDATGNKTNLLTFEGAWNNAANPLSETFWKRWF